MYVFWVFFCAIVVSLTVGVSIICIITGLIRPKKISPYYLQYAFAIYLLIVSFIVAAVVTHIHFLEQN